MGTAGGRGTARGAIGKLSVNKRSNGDKVDAYLKKVQHDEEDATAAAVADPIQ
jgi:hypothetical protein